MLSQKSEGERLIHVRHVACRLGVSERTVRNLAARGDIPAFKVGPKLWRFRVRDIDELAKPSLGKSHQRLC